MFEKQPISEVNILLIDYLTFTTKAWSVDAIKSEVLGLDDQDWDIMDHGFHGYKFAQVFNGVTIMYEGRLNADGEDDMGVCVEISGQGCRALETYAGVSWLALFHILREECNEFNITRLDIAFDDHTGILDKLRLKIDTDDHTYRSKMRTWEIQYGSKGFTIYHGSKKSQVLVRIYDKAAERGLLDGTHWIRVELQLRDGNAAGAIRAYLEHQDLGKVYGGILATYLVYLEDPGTDSNVSRWPVADYWSELIQDAERIHIAAKPGVDYNIFHLENFLCNTAGGGLNTWIEIFGLGSLPELLRKRAGKKLAPKYKMLLDLHKQHREGSV